MQYVFGHGRIDGADIETVRVTSGRHTELSGTVTVIREYDDSHITDTFKVIRKIREADDQEGSCYDWYEIEGHYRYIDRFTPGIKRTEKEITELEIAVMELQAKIG